MNDETESRWLTERMRQLRERREPFIPSFDRVCRGAATRRPAAWMPMRGLAFASVAVALAVAGASYWSFTKAQESRRKEREFAAVESTLLTYWQAPSDALFATESDGETAQP